MNEHEKKIVNSTMNVYNMYVCNLAGECVQHTQHVCIKCIDTIWLFARTGEGAKRAAANFTNSQLDPDIAGGTYAAK